MRINSLFIIPTLLLTLAACNEELDPRRSLFPTADKNSSDGVAVERLDATLPGHSQSMVIELGDGRRVSLVMGAPEAVPGATRNHLCPPATNHAGSHIDVYDSPLRAMAKVDIDPASGAKVISGILANSVGAMGRMMSGTNFNNLSRHCDYFSLTSEFSPEEHRDRSWLWSPYLYDGNQTGNYRRGFALVHHEQHVGPSAPAGSVTIAHSNDAGFTWTSVTTPRIAATNLHWNTGHRNLVEPTNIIRKSADMPGEGFLTNGYFYALQRTTDANGKLEHCLMRAANATSPDGWQIYAGSAGNYSWRSGYNLPASEECYPILPGTGAHSLTYNPYLRKFVVSVMKGSANELGPKGFAFALSDDLKAWSSPSTFLATVEDGDAGQRDRCFWCLGVPRDRIVYPAFLAHTASGGFDPDFDPHHPAYAQRGGPPAFDERYLNFSYTGQQFYVYWTQANITDANDWWGDHTLMRAPAEFSIDGDSISTTNPVPEDHTTPPVTQPPVTQPPVTQPPTTPPPAKLAGGCYRILGGGYYSNGLGQSCALLGPNLQSNCGTSDFNALAARADHGGNTDQGACILPQGCYRIGGTGFYSNGQGASCAFLGTSLQARCATTDFNALKMLPSHGGNREDPPCP